MLCFFKSICTLHCKILFPYLLLSMQIFSTSSIVSNYLCDRCSHFSSIFCFERYGPCILTQHVDNGENVLVTFVESCVRTHLNHISLPQVIVNACVENFFSLEREVLPPVVIFRDFSSQTCFIFSS